MYAPAGTGFDPLNYFYGQFVITAQGPEASEVGEIWATYTVELIQAKIDVSTAVGEFNLKTGDVVSRGKVGLNLLHVANVALHTQYRLELVSLRPVSIQMAVRYTGEQSIDFPEIWEGETQRQPIRKLVDFTEAAPLGIETKGYQIIDLDHKEAEACGAEAASASVPASPTASADRYMLEIWHFDASPRGRTFLVSNNTAFMAQCDGASLVASHASELL